jgi:hypothetical protein
MKICPICSLEHRKRGKTCCAKCASIMRTNTAILNESEKVRREKISKSLINRYIKDGKKIIEKRNITFFSKHKFDIENAKIDIRHKMNETKKKNDTTPHSESVLVKQFDTKKKNNTLPSSKLVIEKSLKTLRSKGPEFMVNINRKRNETFKKHQSNTKSSKADLFFDIFNSVLNLEREHQVVEHRSWFVDFYNREYDMYIQFDGTFWHGLERTQDDLLNEFNKTKRLKGVLDHKITDQKQNNYFEKNNLKLYRISDKDFQNYLLASYNKNSLKSGELLKNDIKDNPELALKIIDKMSYHKSSATTNEKQLNESDKSNLIELSKVDHKSDRNREILTNTEIS